MNATTPFKVSKPRRLTDKYKKELRERAEAAIEQLMAMLDEIDGDADLEPSLATPEPKFASVTPSWFGESGIRHVYPATDQLIPLSGDRDLEEQCEDEGASEGI